MQNIELDKIPEEDFLESNEININYLKNFQLKITNLSKFITRIFKPIKFAKENLPKDLTTELEQSKILNN